MMSVTFNLSPQTSLSGTPYLLIISVMDQSGASSSKTHGTWTINRSPSADNCTPSSSTTTAGTPQTFTCIYSDPDGYLNIAAAGLYFSGNGGLHNEWLHYLVAPNLITMMGTNDSCFPGQAKIISSGYLTLNCAASAVSGSEYMMSVTFEATPQAPSSGILYNNFSGVSDQAAGANGQFVGTWQVQ